MILTYEFERMMSKEAALPSIHLLGRIGGNLEEIFLGIIHLRVEVKTWHLHNVYQGYCALCHNVQFGASQFTSADFFKKFKE
jgi:hypothetical protein